MCLLPFKHMFAQVDRQLAERKTITYIILAIVGCLGVLLPLVLGLWLGRRLMRLAAAMDRIARLDFGDQGSDSNAYFREMARFQSSFQQMERGLAAFGKFVPQGVVKVLIMGQMHANEKMCERTLTILFADIESFSTFCEILSTEQLAAVCTEYFEVMCKYLVRHNGTIDKFIGDCIMAMWNAPLQKPGHERDAVAAALEMQTGVCGLHASWKQKGLPDLKFRAGIHTGPCLVGNFGCSYRVSYTSLGDTVNLASRLEAINKKFGTYICLSHATYLQAKDTFHFRMLAKVTVPGKSEVVPIYEALFGREEVPHCSGDSSLDVVDGDTQDTPYVVPRDGPRQRRQVIYHWQWVDPETLLRQSDRYETAYNALIAGNISKAKATLTQPLLLPCADKAWEALDQQRRQLQEKAAQWDGVFYFTTKED